MCRGKASCSELAIDPSEWDRFAPLRPPLWFAEALHIFEQAVELASIGDLDKSRTALVRTREGELRQFFVEHGQKAGRSRMIAQGLKRTPNPNIALDPVRRVSAELTREVLDRDRHQCRYCGVRVVARPVLVAYSELMGRNGNGSEVFRVVRSVAKRHGIVLAFRANVDHLVPHSNGGRTSKDNLVTSCCSCNYGKASYTLGQLRLDDPRSRPPMESSPWRGLTEHLNPLRLAVRGRQKA